jgi:hypothetical protein
VQNVVKLPDPAGISEMIASLAAVAEGVTDAAGVERHLREAGTNKKVVHAVRTALEPLAARVAAEHALTDNAATGLATL